jgi:site-specific DNA recombinase
LEAVLSELNISLRLLHEQLKAELARIDVEEENLLDLAAGGDFDTGKIRTRLTGLQAKRREIQKRLGNSDERMQRGAAVLEFQLNLLHNPQELYRQLSDHGRRLLNQATFNELLVDQDHEELTIRVVGQTYAEPVRDLMLAAHAYREQEPEPIAASVTDRPATGGGPANGTLAGLLSPVSLDGGWSKTAMVELRGLEPLASCMPCKRSTS